VGQIGDTFTFAVEAVGDGLTYQWQYSSNSGASWSKSTLPGNKTAAVTAEFTEMRLKYLFRCVVTDSQGNTAISNSVRLVVAAPTLTGIAVTTLPFKTEYIQNTDEFIAAGGKLTLYYSDNTEGEIDLTEDMVSGFDNTTVGTQTLLVSCNGQTATFQVAILGQCGDSLYWSFDEATGILTITGSGAMENYSYRGAPWYSMRDSITGLSLHQGLTSIGNHAFENCMGLTSVTIPTGVTSIGNAAFDNCANITSINIPEGVTSVGRVAFGEMGIPSITVPASLTSIGDCAFAWNPNLTAIHVDAANTAYCDADGVLFTKDMTRLIAYPTGRTASQYTIPAGVTAISGNAFENCAALTELTVPVTVTRVGYAAFNQTGLTDVYYDGSEEQRAEISIDSSNDPLTAAAWHCQTELVITTQPENYVGEIGDTFSFTVEAIGDGLSYQWQYSGNNGSSWSKSSLSGNKTNTVTAELTQARLQYLFRCVITDSHGNTVTSNAVCLEEAPALFITAEPQNYVGEIGDAVTFTVEAIGEGLTYQWQYSGNSGSTWTKSTLTGAKTATLSMEFTQARLQYLYRCVITDNQGNTVTSNAVRLEKNTYTITFDANGGTFDYNDPTDTTYRIEGTRGEPSSFSIGVMHSDPRMVREGWYYDAACTQFAVNDGEEFLPDGDVTLYAKWTEGWLISFESNGGQIYGWNDFVETDQIGVRKGDPIGYWPETVNTEDSVFEGWYLNAEGTGESIDLDAYVPASDMTLYARWFNPSLRLRFTAEPQNYVGQVGDAVTFTVAAVGEGLTYQWQYSGNNGATWTKSTLTGAKTATLSMEFTEGRLKYLYRCVITDSRGNSLASRAVRLEKGQAAFTVTFDFNGGYRNYDPERVSVSQEIKRGKGFSSGYNTTILHTDPHLAFDGWYLDATCTQPVPFVDGWYYPTEDMTVYAGWTAGYRVTFDANGGTMTAKQLTSLSYTYPVGSRISSYYTPAREGMALTGWFLDPACTEESRVDDLWNYALTSDVTFYAGWSEAWTITLDFNGGYLADPEQTTYTESVRKGESFGGHYNAQHADPELVLEGWYFDAACTRKAFDDGSSFTPEADVTLYAKWSQGHTITFDANGGNLAYTETRRVLEGHAVEHGATVHRDGMAFDGWYLSADCSGDSIDLESFVPTESLTLYAGWTDAWTLTFNGNGGTVNDGKTYTVTVLKGNAVSTYVDTRCAGMVFDGWYLNARGTGAQIDLWDYVPDGDVTLYANWSIGWTVTLNANGGSFYYPGHTTITNTYRDGDGFFVEEFCPQHADGHMIFDGWFHDAACTEPLRLDGTFYYPHKNVTLYAKWTEGYIVTYNANGGYLDYGEGFTEILDYAVHKGQAAYGWNAHRDGKVFAGWFLDRNCTVNANISLTMNTAGYVPTADVTVYAKWVDPDEAAILVNPEDYVGRIGGWANFEVQTTATYYGADLTYRWEYYDGSAWNDVAPAAGSSTLSLEITAENLGYQYRCVVTDQSGNSVVSSAARIVEPATELAITAQPEDYVGQIGDTFSFTVEATGDGLSYQWQYSGNNGSSWSKSGLSGNKTNTVTAEFTEARLQYLFRCVITDSRGNKVTSNAVRLEEATLAITAEPVDYIGQIGDHASFTVAAIGDGLSYQWQYSSNGTSWYKSTMTGNKTATLSGEFTEARLKYFFRCVITDQSGESITSEAVRLHKDFSTITFNANGGFFNNDGSLTEISFNLPYGKPLSWLNWDSVVDHPEGGNAMMAEDFYLNPDGTGDAIDWDYVPTGDMTFYVNWKQTSNYLFHANGGHINFNGTNLDYMRNRAPMGYENTEHISQEYLVSDGREFLGWYAEPECVNLVIAPGATYVMNEPEIHLYAKWSEVAGHTVIFHANGGQLDYRTYDQMSFFVKEGDAIGFEVGVNNNDHIFVGWNLAADGSGQEVDPYAFVPTADVTIYAQWTEKDPVNLCTVTLNANGGYFNDDPEQTTQVFQIERNTTFQNYLSASNSEGKLFTGWFRTADGVDRVYDLYSMLVTEDVTLYAGWADKYTVTFNANGGWFGNDRNWTVLTRKVARGSRCWSPNVVNPDVHLALEGWYFDAACTDLAFISDAEFVPTGDVTLYAKWAAGYVISWNANGGFISEDVTTTVLKGRNVNYGPYVTAPDGKMLAGWAYSPDSHLPDINFMYEQITPTQDIVLYAVWTADIGYAYFDANGGYLNGDVNQTWVQVPFVVTGYDPDSGEANWNDIPSIAYSLDGRGFLGWNSDPDGDGYWLWSGENYFDSGAVFYAIWDETAAPVVTFDANGGYFDYLGNTRYTETLRWNEQGDGKFSTWSPTVNHADGNKAFTGWYLDAECTQLAGTSYVTAEEDVTLYAGWEDDCWTVTLDANGGTVDGRSLLTVKVAKGQSLNRYYEAEAFGGRFDGWNLKADGSGQQIGHTWDYTPTADVTLYARWSTWHVVTLDANGGRFHNDPSQMTKIVRTGDNDGVDPSWYDENVSHSDPHLTLEGWYWDAACTDRVNYIYTEPGQNMDVTVYAHWVPAYQVTLDANGQYFYADPTCTSVSFSTLENNPIVVNWRLERNVGRYRFIGWYLSPSCIGDPVDLGSFEFTADTTFYAGWKQMYMVVFDANGGRFPYGDTETREWIEGDRSVLKYFFDNGFYAPRHENEALAFDNWYFDAACTRPVSVGFRPTADITLYAGWTSNVHTVTFDANGEFFNNDPNCTVETRFVARGDVYLGAVPDTYHDSAVLNGWYLDKDCTEESRIEDIRAFQPTADVTIYAGWTLRYYVKYDGNGGYFWNDRNTTEVSRGWYQAGDTVSFDWNEAPKYAGKAFLGWSLTPNGGGELYALRDEITVTGETILYAQWADAWSVTFDLRGVKLNGWYGGIENGKMVLKGSAVNESFSPHPQNGNYFLGWYLDEEYTGDSVDVARYVPTADTVFYAKWEPMLSVTMNANGGRFGENAGIISRKDWVRRGESFPFNWYGYDLSHANEELFFDGWYLDEACTEPLPLAGDLNCYPTEDMVLYAKWSQDSNVVEISAATFPDAAFRSYVRDERDANGDGWLSKKEIKATTYISVSHRNILDLTGVAYFTDLQDLYCYGNQLTSLDVGANVALQTLECGDNQLTALDVSANTALRQLYCYNNRLTALDVSSNAGLTWLYCYDNQLTSLDVSSNAALQRLRCGNNRLTSLDLSQTPQIKNLDIRGNTGLTVDISPCPALVNMLRSLDAGAYESSEYNDWNNDIHLYADYGQVLLLDGDTFLVGTGFAQVYTLTFHANGGWFYGDAAQTEIARMIAVDGSIGNGWYTGDLHQADGHMLFDGWYLDAACTEPVPFDGNGEYWPAGDMDLYAGWIEGRLVTFDANGGYFWGNPEATVREDGCRNGTAIDNWDREIGNADEHIAFDGWYLDAACTEPVPFDGNGEYYPTADVTFYAKWAHVYAITLNANGGWFWDNTEQTVVMPRVREGDCFLDDWYWDSLHHANEQLFFDSWYLDAACTEPVPFVDRAFYPTGDMTLYAKWTEDSIVAEINEANFPDATFRSYVCNFDRNGDGSLYFSEARAVMEINVGYWGISDLTGIAYFTNLQHLYCHDNQLASLDVSQNTALQTLNCCENQLTTLDVSANAALKSLDCGWNQLTSLDVSQNNALQALYCYGNQLTSLDVSQNTALQTLNCCENQLTTLDVSANTALRDLYCSTNQLTTLDVSANAALNSLDCGWNQLTSLNVSRNTALRELRCYGNQLTTLDVSANTALQTLECGSNQLTALDISLNTALGILYCDSNRLTALDVSQNTALQTLGCNGNQLTMLDVSANTALQALECGWNRLTSLDVSANTALQTLACNDNQLTALDLSQNVALQILECGGNRLTNLDLSHTPQINRLRIRSNTGLVTVDISPCPALVNMLRGLDAGEYGSSEYNDWNNDTHLYADYGQVLLLDGDTFLVGTGFAQVYTLTFHANGGWFFEDAAQTEITRMIAVDGSIGNGWYTGDLHQADEHMLFDGWYLDAACTQPVPFDGNGEYWPAGDMALYAGWTEGWLVTWDANGGRVGGEESTITRVIPKGDAVNINWGIDRDGYTHVGWYTNPALTEDSRVDDVYSYVPTADVTFYAKWAPIYTVTLNANGGYFYGDVEHTQIGTGVAQGEAFWHDWYVGDLYHADEHMHFDGWYLDAACTQPVPFDGNGAYYPAGDMPIYAGWKSDLAITAQPQDYAGLIGDTASFTVEAQGVDLTYQWQWYNGSDWANSGIIGNKTKTLTPKMTAERLAYQYRCVITDSYGYTVTSDPVRMVQAERAVLGGNTAQVDMGSTASFLFTPAESGYYLIESTGDVDTYVNLYQGAAEIANDDDSGVNSNFRLLTELEGGVRYRIDVRALSSDYTGAISFTVSKPQVATVTFDFTGGRDPHSGDLSGTVVVIVGRNIDTWPADPIRDDADRMSFGGWYLDANCAGDPIDVGAYCPENDTVFYAKWLNIYTVTVYANGGYFWGNPEATVREDSYADGTVIGNWDREIGNEDVHRVFDGWYLDAACTEPVPFDGNEQYTITGNVAIYAGWKSDLAITAQPQDYAGLIGDTASFTVEAQGVDLTYQWQWYNGSDWANSGIIGNKTKTLTPKMTAERLAYQYRCVITDSYGYTVTSGPVRMVQAERAVLGDNAAQVSAGAEELFTFRPSESGYYRMESTCSFDTYIRLLQGNAVITEDDDNGEGNNFRIFAFLESGTKYTVAVHALDSGYSGELTFVIQKVEQTFRVTMNANGGYLGDFETDEIMTRTVPEGDKVGSYPPVYHRDGLSFGGWYTDLAFTDESRVDDVYGYVPTGDVTLYARWLQNYTVTFHANGGYFWNDSGQTVYTTSYQEGSGFSETEAFDARHDNARMAFYGWYYDAAGTEPVPVVDGTIYPTQSTDLYMKWDEGWVLTFDANGGWFWGDRVITSIDWTVPKGKAFGAGFAPEKDNASFEGWYLDAAGTEPVSYNENGQYLPNQDVTLYAKWQNLYTITLNANGGWFWGDENETVCAETVWEGDGFWDDWHGADLHHANGQLFFDGWYLDDACTQPASFVNRVCYPTGDMTLYAKWAENSIVDAINETNFPDAAFRSFVEGCDSSGDGSLSLSEVKAVTHIDVSWYGISDLTGIAYFTNLRELYCSDNQLTALDLSANTALRELICNNNQLTSLNVSANTVLRTLYCYDNRLTNLDVSSNAVLERLSCHNNQLTALNVNGNPELKALNCQGNQIGTLDVSNNPKLEYLDCADCGLTSVDVSQNPALTQLRVDYQPALTNLNLSNNPLLWELQLDDCTDLTSLDLSHTPQITHLFVRNTGLTTLDISSCQALADLVRRVTPDNYGDSERFSDDDIYLYASNGLELLLGNGESHLVGGALIAEISAANFPDATFRMYVRNNFDRSGDGWLSETEINEVTSIHVRDMNIGSLQGIGYFTALDFLDCGSNNLTALDLSGNTALTCMDCDGNSISSLNISACTNLETLFCGNNQLATLDVSNNSRLENLHFNDNRDLDFVDLSNKTALKQISTQGTALTSLDVSACPKVIQALENATPTVAWDNHLDYELPVDGDEYIARIDRNLTVIGATPAAPASYTAIFYADPACSGAYAQQIVEDGSRLTAPAEPTRVGFMFGGWYAEKPGVWMSNGDGTLYIDLGNGETVSLTDALADWEIIGAESLFDAWNFDQNTVTEDTVLYAKWTEFVIVAEINETNFPDATFRSYVSSNFDSNGDGLLIQTEVDDVMNINVNDSGISDLTGIGHFYNLQYLYCSGNQLSTLDISQNIALRSLNCDRNQLTALNVSQNESLTDLSCSGNANLIALDVSANNALHSLHCSWTGLATVDVSHNEALTELSCGAMSITALDLSHNPLLKMLNVEQCSSLTTLDLSQNPQLENLMIRYSGIRNIDISPCSALVELMQEPQLLYVSGNEYCYTDGRGGITATEGTVLALGNGETFVVGTALAQKYTLTFDANGGTFPTSGNETVTAQVMEGDHYVGDLVADYAETPTLAGNVFDGWYCQATGVSYDDESCLEITGDVTLTAQWRPAIVITSQPVNFVGQIGEQASFTVAATGEGLSYQWQYSSNNGGAWHNSTLTGNKTATVSAEFTEARLKYIFRCVITDANGNTVASNAVRMEEPPAAVIVAQPVDYVGQIGDTAAFTVGATGDGLEYMWQYSQDGASWTDSLNDEETMSLKIKASNQHYQYRCVITDAYGNTVTSNVVRFVEEQEEGMAMTQSTGMRAMMAAPSMTAPAPTEPETTEPEATEPEATEPEATEPEVEVTEPELEPEPEPEAAVITVSVSARGTLFRADGEEQLVINATVSGAGEGASYCWQVSSDGGETWDTARGERSDMACFMQIMRTAGSFRYRLVVEGVVSNEIAVTVEAPVAADDAATEPAPAAPAEDQGADEVVENDLPAEPIAETEGQDEPAAEEPATEGATTEGDDAPEEQDASDPQPAEDISAEEPREGTENNGLPTEP